MPSNNQHNHLLKSLLFHGKTLQIALIRHDADVRRIRAAAWDFWSTWIELQRRDHNFLIDFLRSQKTTVDEFLNSHLAPLERFDECSRRELTEAIQKGVKRSQFINRGRFAVHKPSREPQERMPVSSISPPELTEDPTIEEVIQQNELYRKQIALLERENASLRRDLAIAARKVQRLEAATKAVVRAMDKDRLTTAKGK